MSDNPRIEDLRRRVQKDPASIAFAQLAEEYRRAGQFQESVDACCAGLVLHPGYLSARVTLGRALIELGDIDQAQRELETVLKSAPENLAAIRGIADVHYKRGSLTEALQFYRTALGLAQNDPDLEQTVTDLAQRLGPAKRAEPKDGLSLEQMQREISERVTPPPPARSPDLTERQPAPAPALALRIASPGPVRAARDEPGAPSEASPDALDPRHLARGRALRTIAALEEWLDAVHATRAHQTS